MAAPINFESSWQKDIQRKELRDAREKVLDKAKARYERQEQKKEEAHARGDDVWMLPSLNDRLEDEKKVYEKSKKKKKKEKKEKKKKKKEKKEKKARKKKKKESGSSSSESESDEDETEGKKAEIKGPKLQRDDWMTAAPDFFPSVSRQELRDRGQEDKPKEAPKEELPGQNARELNPYWKEGGTGMPTAEQEEKKKESILPKTQKSGNKRVMGDCGLGWLKKAHQRCVTQAEERGCSVDEVAAERYGSLQNLKNLIAQTEQKLEKQKEEMRREERAERNQNFPRPEERRKRSRSRERNRPRFHRPDDDQRRRSRSPFGDRRSRDDERTRSRFMRPGEGSSERSRHDDRTPAWRKKSSRDEREGDGRRGMDERRDEREGRDGRRGERRDEREDRRVDKRNEKREETDEAKEDGANAWMKKSFNSGSNLECIEKKEEKRKEEKREQKKREKSPSSESSASSESEESESEEEEVSSVPQLTEKEMNELGAKLIRAELMGNEELCQTLKAKLEAGRHVSGVAKQPVKKQKKTKKDDNLVVLTRTDKHGISRPLPERSQPKEPTRGRKKRDKIKTHDETGLRERYFQDDDKHDLKTLVAREKMGTAEDQNLQFARLAGRVKDNLDDDEYNVDDAVLQKATDKTSEFKIEERDRHLAILEHKTMSKALAKCPHCFENVPKHLIIAIGMKVYLSLPPHRSLTDGHCLIVPMQHVSQSTVLDEDVWQEIQIFRKGLTAMFLSDDDDCVYMETCMRLKQFPHMAIECIPLPKELGDMAPIYFKKALQDCEKEWLQNKKVVELSGRNIRSAVPKGFPYFSVDFGLQGGFAHVIEEENEFPYYFGREIVGGMLDKEPSFWRKPHRENFEQQRSKVIRFAEMWKPFDWTARLRSEEKSEKEERMSEKQESSDSSSDSE